MKKQKRLNLGPKMPCLGIFDQECLICLFLGKNFLKNYCRIWNQHPQICLIAKFLKKQKCLNLGPKISFLGIFGLGFENNIVIFEISTLEIVKYESLTNTVSFGIESAFSKGPGYAFSEVPGPGPVGFVKYAILTWLLGSSLE